jgi:hypothetical protein
MVASGARISLNEIAFGSSAPAGSVEMLRFLLGSIEEFVPLLYSEATWATLQGITIR